MRARLSTGLGLQMQALHHGRGYLGLHDSGQVIAGLEEVTLNSSYRWACTKTGLKGKLGRAQARSALIFLVTVRNMPKQASIQNFELV